MRLIVALVEGTRFLWAFRRASRAYWRWRLGTIYGSFDGNGTPRPLRELVRDLWRDRRRAVAFLLWRRGMCKRQR